MPHTKKTKTGGWIEGREPDWSWSERTDGHKPKASFRGGKIDTNWQTKYKPISIREEGVILWDHVTQSLHQSYLGLLKIFQFTIRHCCVAQRMDSEMWSIEAIIYSTFCFFVFLFWILTEWVSCCTARQVISTASLILEFCATRIDQQHNVFCQRMGIWILGAMDGSNASCTSCKCFFAMDNSLTFSRL